MFCFPVVIFVLFSTDFLSNHKANVQRNSTYIFFISPCCLCGLWKEVEGKKSERKQTEVLSFSSLRGFCWKDKVVKSVWGREGVGERRSSRRSVCRGSRTRVPGEINRYWETTGKIPRTSFTYGIYIYIYLCTFKEIVLFTQNINGIFKF